jgi:hypothetical protein
MRQIAANAEKLAADSLQTFPPDNDRNSVDSNMVLQSIQRDELPPGPVVTGVTAPEARRAVTQQKPFPAKSTKEKPGVRPERENKTIKDKRNDY